MKTEQMRYTAFQNIADFVMEHISDDVTRLILEREKWPDIDMETAVNSIESRRKLYNKVKEWHDEPRLIFPNKLSAEQCSSSATARYKARLAERIAEGKTLRIADLTGGLGVDSWFFSKRAESVLYNEMQRGLCDATAYNFDILGASNILISNQEVTPGNCPSITEIFKPDIIYMDPARRATDGRKVFMLEDCTPDILTLKEILFKSCRHILVKLSPMADVSLVCSKFGNACREVHIVASGGECKELLVWMDREWNGEYSVTAAGVAADKILSTFTFFPSEETESMPMLLTEDIRHPEIPEDKWLFEPGKALMKAGAFNLISSRFNIKKIGKSTHYYITDKPEMLETYGKTYRIVNVLSLDKRSMKVIGKEYPSAEVTARNIPMDTATLRKKLGVSSGESTHIFGLRSDHHGNLIIITERVRNT